jgi:two-component system chemotaxis response regulator CheY
VVFCTVENELDRIREALAFGANEYIMKPFDGDIVAGKLAMAGAL